MKAYLIIGLLSGLLVLGGASPRIAGGGAADTAGAIQVEGSPLPVPEVHRKQAYAVLTAAKAAYQTTQADYDDGTAVFSELCIWSRRWLDAELRLATGRPAQVAALQKHWQRMKKSYNTIKALNAAGARGGEKQKVESAQFFLAEAELWIAMAGGTVPASPDD
jgi:hypothetical protein